MVTVAWKRFASICSKVETEINQEIAKKNKPFEKAFVVSLIFFMGKTLEIQNPGSSFHPNISMEPT